MATRRVVTGTTASGKSCFVHDGPIPGHLDLGVAINDEIWVDDPARPDPQAGIDPATEHTFHLEPPPGGSVMRIFTFPPANVDSEKVAAGRRGGGVTIR